MKDTYRTAEACRKSADNVRRMADRARTVPEREAFQRLADGYEVLAHQLEHIVERPDMWRENPSWLFAGTGAGRHREH